MGRVLWRLNVLLIVLLSNSLMYTLFLKSDFCPYFYVSIRLDRNFEKLMVQYVYLVWFFNIDLYYQNVYFNDI